MYYIMIIGQLVEVAVSNKGDFIQVTYQDPSFGEVVEEFEPQEWEQVKQDAYNHDGKKL